MLEFAPVHRRALLDGLAALLPLLCLAWLLACDQGKPPSAADEALDVADLESVGDDLDGGGDPDGRFRRRRAGESGTTDEQAAEIEQLEAIGYVSGSRAAGDAVGVVRYDPERAFPGYNFYVSGHATEAYLMDMEGKLLHRWSRDSSTLWPEPQKQKRLGAHYFRRAYPFENGDILAIYEGLGLAKLDKHSEVIWATPPPHDDAPVAHHDLEVQPNGDLVLLTRKARILPWINKNRPVLDDFVTVLDSEGRLLRRVSVLEAFHRSRRFERLLGKKKKGNLLHSNAVNVLDGSVADRNPAFTKGRVLISMRNNSGLAVIDLGSREVVWASRGPFHLQHDPEILPNGHLLLFDNGRRKTQSSRAIELDPGSLEVLWQYAGTPEEPLWSASCGTVQRLPNGNTLINESNNGRSIEVTPAGEIVWEFLSPHRAGENDEMVATLFDVIRLPADFPVDWAEPPDARP